MKEGFKQLAWGLLSGFVSVGMPVLIAMAAGKI